MSVSKNRITAPYLMYVGTIPFVSGALILFVLPESSDWIALVQQALAVYALVIGSFMAGVHWGQQISLAPVWQRSLMFFSNAIALALWLGFLLLPFQFLMLLFVAAFSLLLVIDYGLAGDGHITRGYFFHRTAVTAIVCTALIVSALVA